MPSGWTRWLLEQFEFPFQLVYAPELDKGGLRDKFDVLILVDGAYRPRRCRRRRRGRRRQADQPDEASGGRRERAAGQRPCTATSAATSPSTDRCRN